jgi:hypothetical protein
MKRMGKIHIINQYVYPDGSPVCLIAEQVANYLYSEKGAEVVMVGGAGEYRPSTREKPSVPLVSIQTKSFKRDTTIQILLEYFVVFRAFWKYIRNEVKEGDTVVLTSSPFTNAFLRRAIRFKKVKTFFCIFDYFPAAILTLNYPKFICKIIQFFYNNELKKFDSVIKASYNVGYFGENAVVKRLWNMIDIEPDSKVIPEKKALYTGNLGIAHDVEALAQACEKLKNEGYEINIHADGPGLEKLPEWLKKRSKGIFTNANDLIKALYAHEIHLITGTPGTDEASFPSKIWNSLAAGRKIVACGFEGKMNEELEMILASDYKSHLANWANFILENTEISQPIEN